MHELVKAEYQTFEVMFSEEGWFNATKAAEKYGKRPVLYCIRFKHGLMKVGCTATMAKRLTGILSHGLLNPLFESLVVVPVCGTSHLNKCEKTALRLFAIAAKQYGQETFFSIEASTAKAILRHAAKKVIMTTRHQPPFTEADYLDIATKSGLLRSLQWLAKQKLEKYASEQRAVHVPALAE